MQLCIARACHCAQHAHKSTYTHYYLQNRFFRVTAFTDIGKRPGGADLYRQRAAGVFLFPPTQQLDHVNDGLQEAWAKLLIIQEVGPRAPHPARGGTYRGNGFGPCERAKEKTEETRALVGRERVETRVGQEGPTAENATA